MSVGFVWAWRREGTAHAVASASAKTVYFMVLRIEYSRFILVSGVMSVRRVYLVILVVIALVAGGVGLYLRHHARATEKAVSEGDTPAPPSTPAPLKGGPGVAIRRRRPRSRPLRHPTCQGLRWRPPVARARRPGPRRQR